MIESTRSSTMRGFRLSPSITSTIARLDLEDQKRAMEIVELDRKSVMTAASATGATFSAGQPVLPTLKDGAPPVVLQNPPAATLTAIIAATPAAISSGAGVTDHG